VSAGFSEERRKTSSTIKRPGYLRPLLAGNLEEPSYGRAVEREPPVTADPTILICEDEASLRELVRVSLGENYGFLEATDGNEALDLARTERPDVVVLDLMLPGLSGLDVLAKLREDRNGKQVPVVVISAWGDARDDAFAAGADRFVLKPFDPDDLRAVVEELVA
jgi:DNA-binding response OmpR family regulator